jgi:TonB family protein
MGRNNTETKLAGAILLAFGLIVVGPPSNLKADDVQKQLEKAEKLYKDGKWDEAASESREILKESPGSVAAHQLLGLALEHAGNADGALAEYREVIRLQPQNDGFHYRAAGILAAKGDADAAIAQYREAIRLNSDEALYHFGLGLALDRKNDLRTALDEYRVAQRLDHHNRVFRVVGDGLAKELKNPKFSATDIPMFTPGGDITAPTPTYNPAPTYSDEARKAKLQGIVVLKIIIDAKGNVSSVRLWKPLAQELDEQAIETVRTWRFKPSTRNGIPVAARVLLEVTFRVF